METSAALWMGLLYYPSMLEFLHILAPGTPLGSTAGRLAIDSQPWEAYPLGALARGTLQ